MKRQVGVMISVALVSFLAGTMFNMNYIVAGGDSKPWDKIWTAIFELQNKVSSIAEKLNQTKTIRFYEPMESYENQSVWKDAAVFTWTPQNATSNSILSIAYYLEYKVEGISETNPYIAHDWRLRIATPQSYFPTTGGEWSGGVSNEEYRWSGVFRLQQLPTTLPWVLPNQAYYNIAFQFRLYPAYLGTVYVRNINIIITVADGLPAES